MFHTGWEGHPRVAKTYRNVEAGGAYGAPVIGISERTGLGMYGLRDGEPVRLDLRVQREVVRRDREVVIAHASREEEWRRLLTQDV